MSSRLGRVRREDDGQPEQSLCVLWQYLQACVCVCVHVSTFRVHAYPFTHTDAQTGICMCINAAFVCPELLRIFSMLQQQSPHPLPPLRSLAALKKVYLMSNQAMLHLQI